MDNYYSFLKEQDEDSSIFYYFVTSQNFVYTVYFKVDEYSHYIQNFPLLLQSGYALGFRKTSLAGNESNKLYDAKIFPTIYQVINDFVEFNGSETVLLYHCDTSDKKQRERSRLFDKWESYVKVTCLERHNVEVRINESSYYLGFIANSNNSNIEVLKHEFNDFAYFIIREK
ncbi:DUF6169 family protein [Mucilaginibacter celer]|uniref:Uncharacterized protein n=1 Tax=Mucilaginibacter celer TaxID=2305508 RepID=A0A494VYY0_9SPHI|nr:DUF6169 family protein [Mucilaginibacter celer]AYL96355.1 hypothetical protein HYN43_014090 [Mucilaginibacter celer]